MFGNGELIKAMVNLGYRPSKGRLYAMPLGKVAMRLRAAKGLPPFKVWN